MKLKSNHPKYQVNLIRDLLKICAKHKCSVTAINGNIISIVFSEKNKESFNIGILNANSITSVDTTTNQTKHNFTPLHPDIIGHS